VLLHSTRLSTVGPAHGAGYFYPPLNSRKKTLCERSASVRLLTDFFNIWLPNQSGLTQTVYKAEVTAFLECCRHRLITLGAENSFSDLYNQ
jgi:hypothetical protein